MRSLRILRTQLIVGFVAVMAVPLGLTYWSFTSAFQSDIQRLVNQATNNMLEQTQSQITALVQTAEQAVQHQHGVFREEVVTFSRSASRKSVRPGQRSIREILKANIVSFKGLRNVGVVNLANKDFYMGFRGESGHLVTKKIVVEEGGGRRVRFWRKKEVKPGVFREMAGPWDASQYRVEERPWYKLALRHGGELGDRCVWTQPYLFHESQEVGITCSKAVYEPGESGREPFAIVFADISLKSITETLKQVEVGYKGRVALVDEDGQVIASSFPKQGEWLRNEQSLPHVTDLAGGVIDKEIWQRQRAKASRSLQEYVYGDREYFASAMAFQHDMYGQSEWQLWVVSSKQKLLSGFRASATSTYLYGALAAALGLVIAILIWWKVTRELSGVVAAFDRVREGDLKPKVSIKRPYLEIERLINGFRRMLAALRLVDAMPVMVAYVDQERRFRSVNSVYAEWFGFERERVYGEQVWDVLGQSAYEVLRPSIDAAFEGETVNHELWLRRGDDERAVHAMHQADFAEDGEVLGAYSVLRDITSIKHAEYDFLTGIYSRRKFEELAAYVLRNAGRYDHEVMLLMIDVDHFKDINDRYGHLVGDEVLKEVSLRLSQALRESDVLGRWGGEEFIILAPETGDAAGQVLAERITAAMRNKAFPTVGRVTVSVGLAQGRGREELASLQRRADEALYRAKEQGRDQWRSADEF